MIFVLWRKQQKQTEQTYNKGTSVGEIHRIE